MQEYPDPFKPLRRYTDSFKGIGPTQPRTYVAILPARFRPGSQRQARAHFPCASATRDREQPSLEKLVDRPCATSGL